MKTFSIPWLFSAVGFPEIKILGEMFQMNGTTI